MEVQPPYNPYAQQQQQQYPPYQQYPQQQPPYEQMPKPDTNLVWAILTTVLCCLPLGIVSIVYASKVDGLWYQGRIEEAQRAAKNSRTWAIVSAVVGFVGIAIYVGMLIFLGSTVGIDQGF